MYKLCFAIEELSVIMVYKEQQEKYFLTKLNLN